MLRNRRLLSCHYCGKRSDTYFNRNTTKQFDCRFCLATNHLDKNGDITNPPIAQVNAASSIKPQYAPRPNVVTPTTAQSNADSIFCETCLKNQRLFVASIAQYEAESDKDDFKLDKDYYRYRRNLSDRYPQCCEQCRPRAEAAIHKADYQAKTDYLRRMVDKSRDSRTRTTRRRSRLDLLHGVGKLLWVLAMTLQFAWHLTAFVALNATDESGMRDPDDDSWTTKGLQRLDKALQQGPGDELIWWSLLATAASIWWNPKIAQVIRGFDRHLLGLKQWYFTQAYIAVMRLFLHKGRLEGLSWSAQVAAHLICTVTAIRVATNSPSLVKADSSSLFGNQSDPPSTPDSSNAMDEGSKFWKQQPVSEPTMSESFIDALKQGPQQLVNSNDSERSYPYQFVPPSTNPPQTIAEEDAMEWQPTGSTTLPRALRNPNLGSGNRPFGQAPVQENNRPFYFRAPNAPTNPSSEARNGPKQPVIRPSQRQQNGFNPQSSTKSPSEFQPPKFFADPPAPDKKDDEQLAGLTGSLSFDESQPKKGGWFGFGR